MDNNIEVYRPGAAPQRAVSLFEDGAAFNEAWAMAERFSRSELVPAHFRGKPQNIIFAMDIARCTGSNPLVVMQSLYEVRGKFGFEAKYLIAAVQSSGRYDPIRYRVKSLGTKRVKGIEIEDKECVAWAKDRKTQEIIEGPPVSCAMAVMEGWWTRNGSVWPTMTDLMLQYRAASMWVKLYCPNVMFGMQSTEELWDVTPKGKPTIHDEENDQRRMVEEETVEVVQPRGGKRRAAKKAEPTVVDAVTVDEPKAESEAEVPPNPIDASELEPEPDPEPKANGEELKLSGEEPAEKTVEGWLKTIGVDYSTLQHAAKEAGWWENPEQYASASDLPEDAKDFMRKHRRSLVSQLTKFQNMLNK